MAITYDEVLQHSIALLQKMTVLQKENQELKSQVQLLQQENALLRKKLGEGDAVQSSVGIDNAIAAAKADVARRMQEVRTQFPQAAKVGPQLVTEGNGDQRE
jgi:hypothetical protein